MEKNQQNQKLVLPQDKKKSRNLYIASPSKKRNTTQITKIINKRACITNLTEI